MPAYNLQTINGMICKVLREEKNIWIRICQTLWCQEQTSMIYIRSWIVPYWSSLRDQECPCLNCSDLVDSCSRERKLLICFVTRLESVANCFDGRPTKLLGDVHKLMETCQLQWLAQLLNGLTSNYDGRWNSFVAQIKSSIQLENLLIQEQQEGWLSAPLSTLATDNNHVYPVQTRYEEDW